ncbi:MAG: hypothetical protein V1936_03240 [Patescibacteria group bacterium]
MQPKRLIFHDLEARPHVESQENPKTKNPDIKNPPRAKTNSEAHLAEEEITNPASLAEALSKQLGIDLKILELTELIGQLNLQKEDLQKCFELSQNPNFSLQDVPEKLKPLLEFIQNALTEKIQNNEEQLKRKIIGSLDQILNFAAQGKGKLKKELENLPAQKVIEWQVLFLKTRELVREQNAQRVSFDPQLMSCYAQLMKGELLDQVSVDYLKQLENPKDTSFLGEMLVRMIPGVNTFKDGWKKEGEFLDLNWEALIADGVNVLSILSMIASGGLSSGAVMGVRLGSAGLKTARVVLAADAIVTGGFAAKGGVDFYAAYQANDKGAMALNAAMTVMGILGARASLKGAAEANALIKSKQKISSPKAKTRSGGSVAPERVFSQGVSMPNAADIGAVGAVHQGAELAENLGRAVPGIVDFNLDHLVIVPKDLLPPKGNPDLSLSNLLKEKRNRIPGSPDVRTVLQMQYLQAARIAHRVQEYLEKFPDAQLNQLRVKFLTPEVEKILSPEQVERVYKELDNAVKHLATVKEWFPKFKAQPERTLEEALGLQPNSLKGPIEVSQGSGVIDFVMRNEDDFKLIYGSDKADIVAGFAIRHRKGLPEDLHGTLTFRRAGDEIETFRKTGIHEARHHVNGFTMHERGSTFGSMSLAKDEIIAHLKGGRNMNEIKSSLTLQNGGYDFFAESDPSLSYKLKRRAWLQHEIDQLAEKGQQMDQLVSEFPDAVKTYKDAGLHENTLRNVEFVKGQSDFPNDLLGDLFPTESTYKGPPLAEAKEILRSQLEAKGFGDKFDDLLDYLARENILKSNLVDKQEMLASLGRDLAPADKVWKRHTDLVNQYVDAAAEIVKRYGSEAYDLLAVTPPNHWHWLIDPNKEKAAGELAQHVRRRSLN